MSHDVTWCPRILVPLRGEKHFKPHLQNRILVPLGGSQPCSQGFFPSQGKGPGIEVERFFQNFRRAPSSIIYWSPSEYRGNNQYKLLWIGWVVHENQTELRPRGLILRYFKLNWKWNKLITYVTNIKTIILQLFVRRSVLLGELKLALKTKFRE